MPEQSNAHQQVATSEDGSLIKQYEQQTLIAFAQWCRAEQPTLEIASLYTYNIAFGTVRGLSIASVQQLLSECPEWVYASPPDRFCRATGPTPTVGEVTRQHLVEHLRKVLQQRGLALVSL